MLKQKSKLKHDQLTAHFVAGRSDYASQLIKLHWGYLLTSKYGTQSTFPEGIDSNGGNKYLDPEDYLSHAHGWATGPTMALSQWAVGFQHESAGGFEWGWYPSSDLKVRNSLLLKLFLIEFKSNFGMKRGIYH
jgi:hypothetical protein